MSPLKKSLIGCLISLGLLVLLGACGAAITMLEDDPDFDKGSKSLPSAPSTEPEEESTGKLPDLVGEGLQVAQDSAQDQDFWNLASKDITGLDRQQFLDSNWQVCTQEPGAGTHDTSTEVMFGVVKTDEDCADRVEDGDFDNDDRDRRRTGGTSSGSTSSGSGSSSTSSGSSSSGGGWTDGGGRSGGWF